MMVTSQPSLAHTRALATAIRELILSILTVSFSRSATIMYAMQHPLTHVTTGGMFECGFDRNLLTICPIGGKAKRHWGSQTRYLALFRTAKAGFVTPSSPVSIKTVSSAFCGPCQASTGLYHSLRECQLPPSPPPPM